MKKSLFFAACLVVLFASFSFGQDSPYAEDLQFVRELRSHGYIDLAREYLDKLAKSAPPELKKELPLERALTEMDAAGEEPDSSKRIALYAQARAEFEAFLRANPKHPRADETSFDIAHATTLQGKAELNRARLEADLKDRVAQGDKARQTLIQAYKALEKLPKTPQTQLAMALNLLDQSETYLNTGSDAATQQSGDRIGEARKILDQLIAQSEPNNKITWQAHAWAGRCDEMQDNPGKALKKYQAVLEASGPATQDGKRLARYFMLLALKKLPKEVPQGKAPTPYLIEQASLWLQMYPNYKHKPEGFGVQYELAQLLLEEAQNPKLNARLQEQYAARARGYLSDIEHTENEFTERAKRLKIEAMAKQGTFKVPVAKLRTFEDCYVRAQYEQMQIGEDAKGNPAQAAAKRKEHLKTILEALETGLKKPDAKDDAIEVRNARALLAFYLLQEGKYKEAIEAGESFAHKDRSSSQAASAAIYALVAYGQALAERAGKADGDLKALQKDPEYKAEQERMLKLARFMEERWPKERAGDLARHEIALHLLRDDKNAEAIKELSGITPAYPSYTRTQFLLARAALQQGAQEKANGDPQGYSKRALSTLTNLPEPPATADPENNSDYLQAKLLLALELLKDKKFKEVDAVLQQLAPKLTSLKLDSDAGKAEEKRKKVQESWDQLALYSATYQADADFKAAKYKEVTTRLDPLVDRFNAGKLAQLKDSGLGASVIGMDLRANVQINNLERARTAIKALQGLQADKGGEKGADNTTAILSQLVSLITQQMDELRKKGNEENLKKAQAGFTTILNEVAGDKQKLTPKLAYVLARCYAGMGEHQKAADLLEKFDSSDKVPEAPLHHAIQLLLVQEYRHLKKTDKARKLLDDVLKSWGEKNIDAQKTHVQVMEDEGKYGAAALLSDRYVRQLVRRLDDNRLRDYYFEFYYHLVYCLFKHAQGMDNAVQKAKAVHDAAQRIAALEKGQGGFGNEESKKRFAELLEKERELREQYEILKGGK